MGAIDEGTRESSLPLLGRAAGLHTICKARKSKSRDRLGLIDDYPRAT